MIYSDVNSTGDMCDSGKNVLVVYSNKYGKNVLVKSNNILLWTNGQLKAKIIIRVCSAFCYSRYQENGINSKQLR